LGVLPFPKLSVSIRIDTTRLNSAIREYMNHTKKDLAEVVNTKAFFIALKALRYTPAAKEARISAELFRTVPAKVLKRRYGRVSAKGQAPVRLIYLIVNARQRQAGRKGLKGAAMADAAQKIIGARMASVGFEKAGWVWALRDLAPFVPSAARYAQRHDIRLSSTPLGLAIGAQPGLNVSALIANRAFPRRRKNTKGLNIVRLESILRNSLQRAVDEEAADTVKYIERKFDERAKEFARAA
jgi:hypothetical protein